MLTTARSADVILTRVTPETARRGAMAIVAALLVASQGCSGSGADGGSATPTGASFSPSSVPSASAQVTYTTQVFMAGMKVTFPSDGWSVYEDHPGEFNLAAPSPAEANIHFWLDP